MYVNLKEWMHVTFKEWDMCKFFEEWGTSKFNKMGFAYISRNDLY